MDENVRHLGLLVLRLTGRETKIFCTLGPKCWSEKGLGKLIDAGLNVARFNFSHGEHSSHQEVRVLPAMFPLWCICNHLSVEPCLG